MLLSTAVVFVLSVAIAWSTIRDVFQILSNSIFLSGLGGVLLSALTTTILGGGPGVALGYLIDKKQLISHYTLRVLRLGLWLPVYLFLDLSICRVPIPADVFKRGL